MSCQVYVCVVLSYMSLCHNGEFEQIRLPGGEETHVRVPVGGGRYIPASLNFCLLVFSISTRDERARGGFPYRITNLFIGI